jgi:cell division protein FtsQ
MPSFAARLPRPPLRAVLAAVLVAGGLAGGWVWLRESPLVAVEHVDVVGASGPEADRVRSALRAAASDMTTLRVRTDDLRDAVSTYAIVRDLRVQRDPPHALRITVLQHVPVAAVRTAGRTTAVAADGTVLRGTPTRGLPVVVSRTAAGGARLDGRTAGAVALLAAAPPALRARVGRVAAGSRGWTATLRRGPLLVFGPAERLRAKWVAASRVLAHRSSAGASYLDLRLPERPAAGGLMDPVAQAKADAPPQAAQPESATPEAAAPAAPQG